jgi:hypothetical protein
LSFNLHKLQSKYLAHCSFLKAMTVSLKLIIGWAYTGTFIKSAEICAVVIHYRECKITICSHGISIPIGTQNIKSFENLSGKAAENKHMAQLRDHIYAFLNILCIHTHHIFIIRIITVRHITKRKRYYCRGLILSIQVKWAVFIRCFYACC